MKVYGAEICGDCRNFKALAAQRGIDYEFVDIIESTANLKEFLGLRDKLPLFDAVREHGGIGIPLFEKDGSYTLDVNEALSWIGQKPMEEAEGNDSACEFCK